MQNLCLISKVNGRGSSGSPRSPTMLRASVLRLDGEAQQRRGSQADRNDRCHGAGEQAALEDCDAADVTAQKLARAVIESSKRPNFHNRVDAGKLGDFPSYAPVSNSASATSQ